MKNDFPLFQTIYDTSSILNQLFKEKYGSTLDEIKKMSLSELESKKILITSVGSYYFISKDGKNDLVWTSPRKVIFKIGLIGNTESLVINEKVSSSLEIDYIIKKLTIENFLVFNSNKEYIKYKGILTLTNLIILDTKELIFKNDKQIPQFIYNGFIISNSTSTEFNKKSISAYFSDYFKNCENNENFEFFPNQERNNLITHIFLFIISKANYFKITGPSNNGKSITLIYSSRQQHNIVYLNLKTLMTVNEKKMVEIFFYELQRLELNEDEIKKVSNIFLQYVDFWKILYLLIQTLNKKKIVFILDQFSKTTVNKKIYENICELVNDSPIKLIICSSINDNIIKDEVIKSLIFNKGIPPEFTEKAQQYYYYYINLINLEKIKSKYKDKKKIEIYKLFNYCDKYIKILEEELSKSKLDYIKEGIYKKIDKTFKDEHIDYKYILINLQNFIKKDIKYEEADIYLKQTPLKYFKLIFYKDFFQIDYLFPFVKIISENCLSEVEVNKYFENQDYLVPEKETNKGIYFERAVIYKIKKCDFLPNKINSVIRVDSIISFNNLEKEENDLNLSNLFENLEKEKSKKASRKKKSISYDDEEIKRKNKSKTMLKKKRKRENETKEKIEKMNDNKEKLDLENINIKLQNEIKEIQEEKEQSETKTQYKDEQEDAEIKTDDGILILQNNSNGALMDLAFLFGQKDNMTFIGFQVKNYGKNTDLKDKDKEKFTKKKLKESLLSMEKNIQKTSEIKIKEYHFVFVLYYNDKDEEKYNKNLVKFCNINDIKYIFYNPVLKTFYNKNEEKIEKLILDTRTNIDCFSKINEKLIFKNSKSISQVIEYLKDVQNPEEQLKQIIQKNETKQNLTFTKLMQKLKSFDANIKSVEILGVFKIKFYELMVYPKDSYGLLYDGDNSYLYYIFNHKNKIIINSITKSRLTIKQINMIEAIRNQRIETVFIIKVNY